MKAKNKKYLDWSQEKNQWLIENRNISFEEIQKALKNGNLIRTIDNKNQKKYQGQKVYLIKLKEYIYQVPFVEDEKKYFLKTIIPSRKKTMKKKIYTHKNKQFTLDDWEQELVNSIENGEWNSVDNQEVEITNAIEAAKNTPPRETISMRVNYHDLLEFKANASQERIPYQTLLGSLIHKYNTGQLVFKDGSDKKYQASKKN